MEFDQYNPTQESKEINDIKECDEIKEIKQETKQEIKEEKEKEKEKKRSDDFNENEQMQLESRNVDIEPFDRKKLIYLVDKLILSNRGNNISFHDTLQIKNLVFSMYNHYITPFEKGLPVFDKFILELTQISTTRTSQTEIETAFNKLQAELQFVYALVSVTKLARSNLHIQNYLFGRIKHWENILYWERFNLSSKGHLISLRNTQNHLSVTTRDPPLTGLLYNSCHFDKKHERQKLILACLHEIKRLNLKRKDAYLYCEKYTTGHITTIAGEIIQLKQELEEAEESAEKNVEQCNELKSKIASRIDFQTTEQRRLTHQLKQFQTDLIAEQKVDNKQEDEKEKEISTALGKKVSRRKQLEIDILLTEKQIHDLTRVDFEELNGHGTRFYEKHISIPEFITKVCNKDTNRDLWIILTTGTNRHFLIEYLQTAPEDELCDLVDERVITSWRNGIYFAEWINPDEPKKLTSRFFSYLDGNVPVSVVACKYFDVDFPSDTFNDWHDIHSAADEFLDYQQFTPNEKLWIYALAGGRLIHHPRRWDTWEVAPYLYGCSGTGKSKWIQFVTNFFEHHDVGALNAGKKKRKNSKSTI